MLRNSARSFGDLRVNYLSEAKRPANRWQELKEKSLSPRRSFSPNTKFELPYRARSPFFTSSDEDDKVEVEDRASRSSAPTPSPGIHTNVKHYNGNESNPACSLKQLDLNEDIGHPTGDIELHSTTATPMSSPCILDLGLSTPPPEDYMDDFITGIFMTLDENGDPVFPNDDDDDEIPHKERATPSAFLFLGDNGDFSVMKKENVNTNAASRNNEKRNGASPQLRDHVIETENGIEKMELEGFGSGFAADLPGGCGTFHNKATGKRVLCYD